MRRFTRCSGRQSRVDRFGRWISASCVLLGVACQREAELAPEPTGAGKVPALAVQRPRETALPGTATYATGRRYAAQQSDKNEAAVTAVTLDPKAAPTAAPASDPALAAERELRLPD